MLKLLLFFRLMQILFVLMSVFGDCALQGKRARRIEYNLIQDLPNIYITPMAEKIGHTWSAGQVWEKHLIQQFYSLLKRHDDFFVAIDLGAQTGCFSLLAKYFPNSQWYAFEPIPEVAKVLKKNLSLNKIKNVVVQQMAASDFKGQAVLKMPDRDAWGLATLGVNPLRFDPVMERIVSCIDLDSFVIEQNIPKVHFMKLDTEGFELYILRGAKKIIMRDRPIMLMEYNETNMKQCGICKEEVDAFLREMGYTWELISSEDILCKPSA